MQRFYLIFTMLFVCAAQSMDFQSHQYLGRAYFDLSKSKLLSPMDSELGAHLFPYEYQSYFFGIPERLLPEMPLPIQELYDFLIANNYIRTVGMLKALPLYEATRQSQEHKRLKFQLKKAFPKLNPAQGEQIFMLLDVGGPKHLFTENVRGFFFRNKDTTANMKDLNWFLAHNQDAENVLRKIKAIDAIVAHNMTMLSNLMEQSSQMPASKMLQLLIDSEYLPRVCAAKLNYLREIKFLDDTKLVELVALSLAMNQASHKERMSSLNEIYPARLEMMLLYSFFLFEEGSRSVTARKSFDDQGTDVFGILHGYSEKDELSVSELLSPIAQDVLDALGFYGQKSDSEKVAVPRKKTKRQELTKAVAKKCASVDESKIEFKTNKTSINPERVENEKVPLETTVHASEVPVVEKGIWLSSTNANAEKNFKLKLSKGHRLLDMFARLLGQEIAHLYVSAGSVSIAIALDNFGHDQLIISTNKPVEDWLIKKALNNLYENSQRFFNKVDDKIYFLRATRELLQNDKCSAKFKHQREKIDRIKFWRAINVAVPSTELERRFKNLFSGGIKGLNFIILDNSFRYHSEINLANYVVNKKKPLEFLNAKDRTQPYQYIGGSMLNCGKCSAMFKGKANIKGINEFWEKYNLLIFTRGGYDLTYPIYMLAPWATGINQHQRKEIHEMLNQSLPLIDSVSINELIMKQQMDLSESDDEGCL